MQPLKFQQLSSRLRAIRGFSLNAARAILVRLHILFVSVIMFFVVEARGGEEGHGFYTDNRINIPMVAMENSMSVTAAKGTVGLAALATGWMTTLIEHVNPVVAAIAPSLGALVALSSIFSIWYNWYHAHQERKKSHAKAKNRRP